MVRCICPRFRDAGGFRIADFACPIHGPRGTEPGDGWWFTDPDIHPPDDWLRERHQVWVWLAGAEPPHWQIMGTGVVEP